MLVLATEQRWRGPYQVLFERGEVRKTYRALAPYLPELEEPVVVRNHIRKERGEVRAEVVPGAPVNAETLVELESRDGDLAVYRLTPRTGRTHQLRLHLHGLGAPIVDDPLYPVLRDVSVDDFTRPLQLLASELELDDPVDGEVRRFASVRRAADRLTRGRLLPVTTHPRVLERPWRSSRNSATRLVDGGLGGGGVAAHVDEAVDHPVEGADLDGDAGGGQGGGVREAVVAERVELGDHERRRARGRRGRRAAGARRGSVTSTSGRWPTYCSSNHIIVSRSRK